MNIHEYQAKELLQKFDVATTRGRVAATLDEAEQIARELAGIPGAPIREDVRRYLPGSLEWLAGMGLLEG